MFEQLGDSDERRWRYEVPSKACVEEEGNPAHKLSNGEILRSDRLSRPSLNPEEYRKPSYYQRRVIQ